MENGVLPKIFLDFLNIRHFPSVPKTESCGWVETLWNKTHFVVLLFVFIARLLEGFVAYWHNFYFSSLRSFDTESEESRWVVLLQLQYKTAGLWSSPRMSVTPPTFLHPVNLYASCYRPQTLWLLLFGFFSVNFHTSLSCCFWETPTCCHLLTVSSSYLHLILLYPVLNHSNSIVEKIIIYGKLTIQNIVHIFSAKSGHELLTHLTFYLKNFLFFLSDAFSNVVIEGVVHGVFYPDLQPR